MPALRHHGRHDSSRCCWLAVLALLRIWAAAICIYIYLHIHTYFLRIHMYLCINVCLCLRTCSTESPAFGCRGSQGQRADKRALPPARAANDCSRCGKRLQQAPQGLASVHGTCRKRLQRAQQTCAARIASASVGTARVANFRGTKRERQPRAANTCSGRCKLLRHLLQVGFKA